MRLLVLILIPYLSLFLETTLFSRFNLQGTVPDLVLLFVAFFAILNGSRAGFAYGFLCGLFEDLYLGRFIGINAMAKGLTGYILGKLEVNVFKDNILVGFGGAVLATLLNSIFLLLLGFLSLPGFTADKATLVNLSGQIAYNGLLSIPFYVWYYRSTRNGVLRINKHKR